MSRRYEPEVYAALADRNRKRRSNREIARLLGVDEATVRRGLRVYAKDQLEQKRARQRKALLTDKGRIRARRFRLHEFQKRMRQRLEDA